VSDEQFTDTTVVDPLDKQTTLEVDMASQREVNLKIAKGAYKLFVFQLDDEEDVSRAREVKLTLKSNFALPDANILLQKDHDPTRSNLAEGKIVFEFKALDTCNLSVDTYWYDIWLDLTTDQRYQVAIGCLTLERTIWQR
jgi:hypothetical protein